MHKQQISPMDKLLQTFVDVGTIASFYTNMLFQ